MATPIQYRKPRRINVVSVSLVLLLAALVYLGYQFLPAFILKHEAYRVLEEHGSTIAGRSGLYEKDHQARERLRSKMEGLIRNVGVNDPDLETWIEIEGKEVRLGVVYSTWIEWPFGVAKPTEQVYELEHLLVLK